MEKKEKYVSPYPSDDITYFKFNSEGSKQENILEETYTLFSCRLIGLHPSSLISIMDASIVTTAGLGLLKVSWVIHVILSLWAAGKCLHQRWASTLANRSNARHRFNIRAPPRPLPPM